MRSQVRMYSNRIYKTIFCKVVSCLCNQKHTNQKNFEYYQVLIVIVLFTILTMALYLISQMTDKISICLINYRVLLMVTPDCQNFS